MRESKQSQGYFHAVSLSGGKDSSYLLLRMIERGMPIDAVLSADTGMEFPEMYDHLEKMDELRKLRKHHPELWAKLIELDRRARAQFGPGPLGQFKKNWSVDRLEERFATEDAGTA